MGMIMMVGMWVRMRVVMVVIVVMGVCMTVVV